MVGICISLTQHSCVASFSNKTLFDCVCWSEKYRNVKWTWQLWGFLKYLLNMYTAACVRVCLCVCRYITEYTPVDESVARHM